MTKLKDFSMFFLKLIITFILIFIYSYIMSLISGKSLFISNVSALEPYNDMPNTITYWSTSDNGITASVKEFNKYNTQFFGYTFNSEQSMQGWSFNFDGEPYLDDKSGSVNFAIYSNVKNEWRKPFQVYIKDYSNNISSCYVDGTSNSSNGSLVSSPVSSVICPNVQVRGNYSIFVSNLTSNIANTIGISKVTYKFVTDKDIKTAIDNNTKAQEDTNKTLKDDNIDDNININTDDLTDESGLQDLLLMPLTLMNAVNTGFNSSCSSFSLGSLYGHNLSLKCFTISDIIGSNLASIIDVIISGIFIYLFSKHLRKIFDRTTNLENEEGDVI